MNPFYHSGPSSCAVAAARRCSSTNTTWQVLLRTWRSWLTMERSTGCCKVNSASSFLSCVSSVRVKSDCLFPSPQWWMSHVINAFMSNGIWLEQLDGSKHLFQSVHTVQLPQDILGTTLSSLNTNYTKYVFLVKGALCSIVTGCKQTKKFFMQEIVVCRS